MKKSILTSLFVLIAAMAAVAQTTATYSTQNLPANTLLADFNGDGRLDVVTFGTGSEFVSVRLNLGSGVYGEAANYSVGTGLHVKGGAVGDINGDGHIDIVVTNNLLVNNITPILNNAGNGTFTVGTSFAVTADFYPDFVGLADLDGDGDLDLMISSQFTYQSAGNYVAGRMLNNGSGSFSDLALYQVGTQPVSMTAADVDGDGDKDIAVANMNSDNITLLFNNGTGGVSWVQTISQDVDSPRRIAFADLDGNGKLDMYVANHDDSNVLRFNNTGSTNPSLVYNGFPTVINTGANTFPQFIAFDDVNGDGNTDLIVSGADVYTFYGNGSGGLGSVNNINLGFGPSGFAVGDLLGLGGADFAATNLANATLTIYLSAVVPTVTTSAASSITTTGATLNGSMNARGSAADASFAYKLSSAGTYSNTIEATPDEVTGTSNTAISASLTGLLPNTSYDFKAVGSNAAGSVDGSVLSFTTAHAAPLATTGSASSISVTTATLNGTVNAQNSSATAYFEYGTSTGVYTTQASVSGSILDGMNAVNVSANLTGLAANTTYYYRLVAANDGGTTNGSEGSFTTTVPTMLVSSVSPENADFNVAANADIVITFNEAVKASTVNSGTFFVRGSLSGAIAGAYSSSGTTATFNPTSDFRAGEVVTVTLTTGIQSDAYSEPLNAIRSFSFTAATAVLDPIAFSLANYASGTGPNLIATGDLNNDGHLDLVSSNQGGSTVSINLSNGNGTFATASNLGSGGFPMGIRIADVNNDGNADIILTHSTSAGVAVYLGNGLGGFGGMSTVHASGGDDIEVLDVNGDGHLDIVQASTGINVLLGNGNGTFQSAVNYGSSQNSHIAKGDMNGDGRMDFVTSSYANNAVRVYLSNGVGTYAESASYGAGTNANGIAVVDMDGDGYLDVVVANYGSNSIGVYLNNGSGALALAETYEALGGPYDLDVADVNGDGHPDVVAALQVGDGVRVFTNTGTDGVLNTPTFIAAGDNPRGIVLADFNGDRKIDIATANNFGNNVSVLKTSIPAPTVASVSPSQNALGVAANANITVTFATPMKASTLVAGNVKVVGSVGGIYTGSITNTTSTGFTFDPTDAFIPGEVVLVGVTTGVQNTENVAMAGAYYFSFTVGVNETDGQFRAAGTLSTGDVRRFEFKDLNNDGHPDLFTDAGYGTFYVFLNQGDGSFGSAAYYYAGGTSDDIILADFNQDGHPDMIAANGANGGYTTRLNNGDGTFASAAGGFSVTDPRALTAPDLNRDGKIDLVFASQSANAVTVRLSAPSCSYCFSATYSVGTSPSDITSADVNNDGMVDVIALNNGSNNVSVLFSNGDGTLAAAVNYAVGTNPTEVTVADVDGDGYVDILVSNSDSDDVSVLLNNRDGTFATAVSYSVGDAPVSVTASDIDGDGALDLLVANADSDNISILMNNGDGTFSAAITYAAGDQPSDIQVLDIDQDGDLDIFTSNLQSDNITILKRIGGPNVIAVTPTANAINVAANANITVEFDVAMNAASLTDETIVVRGAFSGVYAGNVGLSGNTATFNPSRDFLAGEPITVTVTTSVENAAEQNLEYPYTWSFTAESAEGSVSFIRADINSVNNVNGSTVADIDGDGDLDLIVTETGDNYVSVLINDGSGSFASPDNYDVGSSPYSVKAADLNNDGYIDITSANQSGNSISVLLNDQQGGFATAVSYSVQSTPRTHQLADLNGDGFVDIVAYNANSGSFSVLMNNGNGTFANAVHYTNHFYTYNTRLFLADMDGDGAEDVVLMKSEQEYVNYTYQATVRIVKNLGDGVFSGNTTYTIPNQNVTDFSLADLNGDGRLDIAMTAGNNSQVRVFLRNPDGTYPTDVSSSMSVVTNPQRIVAADLDGDGDLDLAAAGNNGELSFMLNAGDGTFGSATNVSTNHNPYSLIAADISGEGQMDLIIGHNNGLNILGPMPAPTTSASNLYFNNDWGTQLYAFWTNGNGTGRIVIMKEGSDVDFVPVSNTSYTPNSVFGTGTELGTGNYVVYNGTSSWNNYVALSNLTMGTEYFFKVYEYRQEGGVIKYRLTNPATGSHTTATSPSTQGSFNAFSADYGQQINLQVGTGSGQYRLIVMKQGSPVDAFPVENTTYVGNRNFGSGSNLGNGNFVISSGGMNSVTITGVDAGTTYHVAVFEYNGAPGSEKYNTSLSGQNTGSTTTNTVAGFPFDTDAGHAVRFTGSLDEEYADLSTSVEFGDQFSVELWVKPSSIGSEMSFYSVTGDLYLMEVGLNASGQFTASVAESMTNSNVVVTGTQLASANTWYHIAMTAQSGGMVRLYVNGMLEGSAAITDLLMEGEDGRMNIGALGPVYGEGEGGGGEWGQIEGMGSSASKFFAGDLDELRVWNRVRTESEIRSQRRSTITGFPDQMIGYWQFNDEDEDDYTYDQYQIQESFSYVTFVKSSAPFGGTSAVASAVQAGPVSLGNVDLTLTDAFDNPVDVQITEITGDPNQFPTGYRSSLGGKVFLVELFGDPGTFSANLTLNFGTSAISAEQEADPSLLKLFKRGSDATGTWTDLGGASTAVASTGDATWTGISSFSQFVVVTDDNLAPPLRIWRLEDGMVAFAKSNYADYEEEENQDRITENVWITRRDYQWIFNIYSESSMDDDDYTSPAGTKWAVGTADDIETMTFRDLYYALDYEDLNFRRIVGVPLVMFIEEENLYIEFQFTGWTQNSNGGGFSYVRGKGQASSLDADDIAGGALSFDGVNDYVYHTATGMYPTAITHEMWVKPAAIPTNGNKMVFASGEEENHRIGIDSDGHFYAVFYDDEGPGNVTITGTTVAIPGQWYHIAASAKEYGEMRLYVNGTMEASNGFGATYSEIDGFIYGFDYYDWDSFFQGELDEIRIWSVERTATEIRANMFNTNVDATGLNALAIWQLNEESGTKATDLIYRKTIDLAYDETSEPTWVTSTAPLGGVSGVATGVQSGTANVGGATLTFTTPFENPVDVFFNEITTEPNVFPTGFTSSIGGKYFVIDLVGNPGTFSLNLTLTFGQGVVTEAQQSSPSMLKLFRRSSGSTGAWTELSGATSAIAATGEVTWAGITAFSEFIVVESEPTDIFTVESATVTAFLGSMYTFDPGVFNIDAFFGDETFTLTADVATAGTLFVDVNDNNAYDAGTDDLLTDASSAEYTPSDLQARLKYIPAAYGVETVVVTFTTGDVSDDLSLTFVTVESTPTLAGVANQAGWYLMSNPLDTPLGTLFSSVWTQGAINSNAPNGGATLYTFNAATSSYAAVTTDLDTTKVRAGEGVLAYIFAFDDYHAGVPEGGGWPKTLTNEGNPFTSGAATVRVRNVDSGMPEGTSGSEGFNLFGNPYAWPLSADSLIATLKRADPFANSYVYRWNQPYQTWQLLTGGAIQPYESVFIRAINSGLDANLQFTYDDRHQQNNKVAEEPLFALTLTHPQSGMESVSNLRFGEKGSVGIDPFDGYYLGSYAPRFANLYASVADQALVITNLPADMDRKAVIPMHLHASVTGEFELSWNSASLPNGWSVSIENPATGMITELDTDGVYRFTVDRAAKAATDDNGIFVMSADEPVFLLHVSGPATSTGVEDLATLPTEVELGQNYPNPFNPSTRIVYGVPTQSQVNLEVFDMLGRRVAVLVNNQVMPAGRHTVTFDAGRLASGVYVYRLAVGNKVMTRRMVLIK